MEKRKDIQIFEMAHKLPDYGLDDNMLYTPLHTGAYDNPAFVCELKDNLNTNISNTNYFFCEETGTYWIWKNYDLSTLKYVGQCQYRRRLTFRETENFDRIFYKYDIILPEPYMYRNTLEGMYEICHNINDLRAVEKIVKVKYPDYTDAWDDNIKNGHILFYSASYIMRKSDYLKWCEFLFNVMEDFRKSYLDYNDKFIVKTHVQEFGKWNDNDIIYQMRIGGYLCERLFTLWVMKNFKPDKMFITKYTFKENN